MLSASELHERGVIHSNAGRFASARACLLKALSRSDDPKTLAQVESSLAYVEAETGSVDEGLHYCRCALARPGHSAWLDAVIQAQLGLLYVRAGDRGRATYHLANALHGLQDRPRDLGNARMNLGLVCLQQGDAEDAARHFEAASAAYAAAGEPSFVARAQHNLGYTSLLTGDLVAALTAMDGARQVLAPLSDVSRAVGEQDRAEVLIAAGLATEAEAALLAAAKAYGTRRLRQMQGEAELILARMLIHDDPRRAGLVARRASRRFSRRGSEAWALRADAVALTSEIERGSRRRPLVTEAEQLARRLRDRGFAQEATALELQATRASIRCGEHDVASTSLRRVRPGRRAPLGVRTLAREVRSELAAARGRRADALDHVRRGLAELHEWQSTFGNLDLQSSLVGHGRRLAFQGLRLAVDDGRPEVVFEWSERARMLVSRVVSIRPPSDPKAADDLAELRQLHAKVRDAEAQGAVPPVLGRREAELRREIRQRAWYDEGSGTVTDPASMDEVRARLARSDAALTAYIVVDDRLHVLVLTEQRVEVRALGAFTPVGELLSGMQADLDVSAASLRPRMRATVHAGLRERVDLLSARLISPISDLIGDRRLVITPSGSLAGTPWTMLPELVGRPVAVPRSASRWFDVGRTPATRDSAGFVAGPRVNRAEEEVRKAASSWADADVLTGAQAHAGAVTRLATSVDVLHVSAHGRHAVDNPLFSGLELVDGPWFGYDIDQIAQVPSTVVLSACELGRSSVRWGEEAVGMTAAWLHAGARCVIASPASVDDDLACEVLSTTHGLLAAGRQPADALAEASAGLDGPVPSPFICYGTGW